MGSGRRHGRFVYTTNFADGAVSTYEVGPDGSLSLANATAGTAVLAHPGLRDEDLSGDGQTLYAIEPTPTASSDGTSTTMVS